MTRPLARRLLLAGLGALAVTLGLWLRLAVAVTAPLWFDEATIGLMGRGVLAGEFPFFFHGQSFMGAVDGYTHAVSFALLGSSVGALRAWPLAVSLLHVALVGLLARRVLGRWQWAAALALLPTVELLRWAHDARLHYDLVLVLTPLLCLLALVAVDGRATPARRARALTVGTLVAGFGWWVNLQTTLPIAAAALLVLDRRPTVPRVAWGLLPLAFAVGSAPVWVYAAWRGHLPEAGVPLAAATSVPEHLRLLVTNALPILMGRPQAFPAGVLRTLLAVTTVALLGGVLAVWVFDRRIPRDGRLLLAALAALALLAPVATAQGRHLAAENARYLIGLVAVMPVLLAGLLGYLTRRSAVVSGAVAALVLGVQATGLWIEYPALVSRAAWQAHRARGAIPARQADELAARGLTAVYTHDLDLVGFSSAGRVTVSHLYQERYPPLATRVDGGRPVAYLSGAVPPGFEASLRAAGIRFEREAASTGTLLTDFSLEHEGHEEIRPDGFAAAASHGSSRAVHAVDRDAATRWDSDGPRASGMWFELDLGRAREVGMVAWLPGGYQEVPLGFRLETSIDSVRWTLAREVPVYYGPLYWSGGHPMGRVRWGRVETRFEPRAARHIRITHLGSDRRFPWSIRELFVYGPGPTHAEALPDARAAAAALGRAGALHVYADHGVGGGLVRETAGAVSIEPANLQTDAYGTVPAPNALPVLRLDPRAAIVYPRSLPPAHPIEEALRAAGIDFVGEDAGGYRLLTRLTPPPPTRRTLPRQGWRARGLPDGADAVLDGDAGTRWSTRGPQRPGQWLEVDLGAPTRLAGIELDLGGYRLDYPRGLALEVARSRGAWAAVPATPLLLGPLVWTGTHVLRAGAARVLLRFPPTEARWLRLTQTRQDPVFDWSVVELRALLP